MDPSPQDPPLSSGEAKTSKHCLNSTPMDYQRKKHFYNFARHPILRLARCTPHNSQD
ncbi:hypothetical protein ACET3Z_029626 [Daucus carota]